MNDLDIRKLPVWYYWFATKYYPMFLIVDYKLLQKVWIFWITQVLKIEFWSNITRLGGMDTNVRTIIWMEFLFEIMCRLNDDYNDIYRPAVTLREIV